MKMTRILYTGPSGCICHRFRNAPVCGPSAPPGNADPKIDHGTMVKRGSTAETIEGAEDVSPKKPVILRMGQKEPGDLQAHKHHGAAQPIELTVCRSHSRSVIRS